MRLPQLAATLWQRASSRAVLPLVSVPVRVLIRPFAPNSTTVSHVKYLHNETKQPDPALKQEPEDSAADDKPNLEARNIRAVSESVFNEVGPEVHQDEIHTATVRRRRPRSEAQTTASRANIKTLNERLRAAGFPNLIKSVETQRAAGFPNLRKGPDEDERAAGFPALKKAREIIEASDWIDMRKTKHAQLVRDIEAANLRKLAEDPNFVPLPLPDLESRPRVDYRKPVGTIPCPRPGCKKKLRSEQSLKVHLNRMHGGYSAETPYKCRDTSCNMYYATKKEASSHFHKVHGTPKA